jgi:anti-sigma factor RsiW
MECKQVFGQISQLAALPVSGIPEEVREHLVRCARCSRAVATERATRGVVRSLAEPVAEPPSGFAARVLGRLRIEQARQQIDAWRPARGLLPAFAAAAVALVIVYGGMSPWTMSGLLPMDDLTAGERLALQEPVSGPDQVLAAIMEDGR